MKAFRHFRMASHGRRRSKQDVVPSSPTTRKTTTRLPSGQSETLVWITPVPGDQKQLSSPSSFTEGLPGDPTSTTVTDCEGPKTSSIDRESCELRRRTPAFTRELSNIITRQIELRDKATPLNNYSVRSREAATTPCRFTGTGGVPLPPMTKCWSEQDENNWGCGASQNKHERWTSTHQTGWVDSTESPRIHTQETFAQEPYAAYLVEPLPVAGERPESPPAAATTVAIDASVISSLVLGVGVMLGILYVSLRPLVVKWDECPSAGGVEEREKAVLLGIGVAGLVTAGIYLHDRHSRPNDVSN